MLLESNNGSRGGDKHMHTQTIIRHQPPLSSLKRKQFKKLKSTFMKCLKVDFKDYMSRMQLFKTTSCKVDILLKRD
jgi:hypothetical protein